MTTQQIQSPPAKIKESNQIHTGCFTGPIDEVNIGGTSLWQQLRLKEWHYTSITTEDWFVAINVVQLGYIANFSVYVIDRKNPKKIHQVDGLIPFGRGLQFAPSSTQGQTLFKHRSHQIQIYYSPDGYKMDLDILIENTRLHGHIQCEKGTHLSMVYPLNHRRLAYTHKGHVYEVKGELHFGNQMIDLKNALSSLDWTRAEANYITRWNWASFTGYNRDQQKIGLNLSTDVYDDQDGDSYENAFYIQDRTIPLSGVDFHLPTIPDQMNWKITSKRNREIDLTFTPFGARKQSVNFGIIRSQFIQVYGLYHGQVLDCLIDGLFGVAENHLSHW